MVAITENYLHLILDIEEAIYHTCGIENKYNWDRRIDIPIHVLADNLSTMVRDVDSDQDYYRVGHCVIAFHCVKSGLEIELELAQKLSISCDFLGLTELSSALLGDVKSKGYIRQFKDFYEIVCDNH